MSMESGFLELLKRGLISIHGRHHNINCGGCGVFATLAYPFISQLFDNVSICLVQYYGKGENVDHTRKEIIINGESVYDKKNWGALNFNHILLKVVVDDVSYLIDSEGVREEEDYCYHVCDGSFTYEEIKALSASGSGWNSWFDRDQIPSINADVAHLFNNELPTYAYG